MALETYRKKRKFGVTAEPRGRKGAGGGHRYVIQKHDATRLHYDLRLELDGVMKSWAVTRGPSLDPNDKRLAVHVEDHPIEYNSFEGTIPEGEYGGGTVMIWDRGSWEPEGDAHRGYAKGHLDFVLHGEKLHGRWHLVRMRKREGEKHDNWLLIKGKDEESRSGHKDDILDDEPLSVATGRTMEEIAEGKGEKRVWHSNRKAGGGSDGKSESKSEKRSAGSRTQTQRDFKAELRAVANARAKEASRPASRKKKTTAKKSAARAKPAVAAISRKRSSARTPSAASPKSAKSRKLPDFVPPSLATLHDAAPSGPQWIHEIKFDGYRIEARLDKSLDRGKVKLLTRKALDWANRFERIADAVAALPAETALLDGELVVENDKGVSSFSLLQTDLKEGRGNRFVYWVFDLLYLDGRDLTGAPLFERKAALARLLKGQRRDGAIRYAEHFEGNGPAIFKSACDMDLEGIISKLRDATYRPGRSENFVKTKCHNAQEFVVAGFSPSNAAPKAVGALTVAFHEHGKLRYAGRVGTGFTHATARDLWRRLEPLRVDRPPLTLPPDERRKNVVWVKPTVVVETEYRGVTHDGLLRQAAYKGLREDKPAREVVREKAEPVAAARREPVRKSPAAKSARPSARSRPSRKSGEKPGDIAGVRLTHPDRVYWPDAGVTKRDLAEYYVAVWERMAPHLVDRPLAVVRAPEGVGGETFYQKHIASTIKESRLRHAVDAKEHDVIAVEKLGDLVALVQSGALEVHARGARLDRLEICDRIVFDLDPGEGVAWKAIVAGAQEVRDRLNALKLQSFVKLTGGKGIHVVLPIDGADWDTTKTFAARVANAMAADSPDRYLAKMTKALRHDKIFIDYFRNSREALSVVAYSTRVRPGAPVSMPVTWQALPRTRAGNQFTVLNAAKHLKADASSDPWAEMGKVKQKLPSLARHRRA